MYDLIIIGGGPAGMTAAIYAIRKRLNVLLATKDLGGKTNYRLALPWIDEYQVIRGLEVVNKFKSELEYLKFALHKEPITKITRDLETTNFIVHTKGGAELRTKSVLVATGAVQKWLNVPGEKEFIMKGLCYSALSYAPLFIDKRTVVIGDSNLALRSAAELAIVAKSVHLVGPSNETLEHSLGKKLRSTKNVTILSDSRVIRVIGGMYAEKVVAESPDGTSIDIPADGTFIEIGLKPNSDMVSGLVDLDEEGRIIIDCNCQTSVPGVFAAGDVTNTCTEQVLIAVGDGAKAVLSAYDYLLPGL